MTRLAAPCLCMKESSRAGGNATRGALLGGKDLAKGKVGGIGVSVPDQDDTLSGLGRSQRAREERSEAESRSAQKRGSTETREPRRQPLRSGLWCALSRPNNVREPWQPAEIAAVLVGVIRSGVVG
jgi:hypothetical protein